MVCNWRLPSIKHLSSPLFFSPHSPAPRFHQSLPLHQGCKQKLITIFMSPPDDKWKREQKRKNKTRSLSLFHRISIILSPAIIFSISSMLFLPSAFTVPLFTVSLSHGCQQPVYNESPRQICLYVCVCVHEFAHYDTDRKAKHPVLYYVVWCFVSRVSVLRVNGEWWRQKCCLCVLTVIKRRLRYSHNAIVLLAGVCESLLTSYLLS